MLALSDHLPYSVLLHSCLYIRMKLTFVIVFIAYFEAREFNEDHTVDYEKQLSSFLLTFTMHGLCMGVGFSGQVLQVCTKCVQSPLVSICKRDLY